MQSLDHLLELSACGPRSLVGRVGTMGGKIGDGVITPVVVQTLIQKMLVLHKVVYWQQLDGGDPKLLQVLDGGGVRETCISAAQFKGYARMLCREALDM